MIAWTSEELEKIGKAEELEIFTLRKDGTARKAVTIWVVRVGDGLYVRSYKAGAGVWYHGAQAVKDGRISAGGVTKDVIFEAESDPALNDQVDAAYRAKYGRYSQYVPPMLTPEVRATTIKLLPRSGRG
jgi:hypothetical protein